MMKKTLFKAAIALSCVWAATAANAQRIDTQNRIFDSNVKSLKVAPENRPYAPAVISMQPDDQLHINFDYIDYDMHYLRYSVTHCNADWQPSTLVESEYVDGFNQADISDYAQSEATFTHYFNYEFSIPNADFQLTKSGNYLLRVFEQDNPDKVLFQKRFTICENSISLIPQVTTRTDETYNDRHQQVSFEVQYKTGAVRDPYNELTAVVTQNGRTDNAVTITHPMMVGTNSVTYDHNRALIFPAGNEYRRMETVNINSLNMGVERIQYFEPFYHATVATDQPRCTMSYLYDQTQFGHFTIRNAEANDSRTEADYIITHFSLFTGGQLQGGTLHLQGEFTEGMPESASRMAYDASTGCYTTEMLLKQGAYNYQYLWYPDGKNVGETAKIEGDKYETRNQYTILLYQRQTGERYDRCVAYSLATSY